jgi:hypothetical protein
VRKGIQAAHRNEWSWRIGDGFIGMPLIGDSQKTTTTDTARTATSNVEFPLPVYHRLGLGQEKYCDKNLR